MLINLVVLVMEVPAEISCVVEPSGVSRFIFILGLLYFIELVKRFGD